jgi:predicted HTH domain antitoxin
MQVAVDLPNEFVAFHGPGEVERDMRASYAMFLVQQGRVTLSKAAQLAGMDIYDFMALCKAHRISTMDLTADEIAHDLTHFEPR